MRAASLLCVALCLFSVGCSSGAPVGTPKGNISITATPAAIAPGSKATLTVSAVNATAVTITGSDGSSYTLSGTGGTQSVSPSATTTYTAVATGTSGTATSVATVAVYGKPTITISANPTAIIQGSSSILTVSATNATTVTISGTDGNSYTITPTGGTQAVSPSTTTTYTATATGPDGAATAKTVLTVSPHPPPTATIVANPASIYVGGSSSLTVSALYATKVTMKSSDGATYTLAPSGGLQGVTPTATTTYVVTATGPYGTVFVSATVTVSPDPQPAVSIVANPSTIVVGHQAFLSVVASNATQVVITGSDGSSFTLAQAAGGTQAVSPAANTTYTATATGMTGTTPATAATTVQTAATGSLQQIDHVVFMLQENRSFDTYFGMLNPYRRTQGWNIGDDGQQYTVDGIDDKLTSISNSDREGTAFPLFKLNSTCIDETSPFWTSSYQDVSINNYGVHRPINMNGFVEQAEGYTQQCQNNPNCSGDFTDTTGQRAMGYYDQDYLNYYYYMASQFAVSDRWFSPIATWTFNNRIATFSGGTTQGLVSSQGSDDLPQLNLPSIFQELDEANVSWKIYYTVTNGLCTDQDDCSGGTQNQRYPATNFSDFTYSYRYIYEKTSTASCVAPTRPSSVVGDSTNSFCVDPTHIAPIANYYTDLANGTLPSFTFIEAGYGNNDEHPGSGQSIFTGQAEVAKVVNALMGSYLWNDSVFFFSFDEGGGLYDHVPPVPGYSNQNTATSLGTIPDIGSIAVNPDSYNPCLPPTAGTATIHCDLLSGQPGASSTDTVGVNGFAAQLGFRLPNIVISPFTRKHYVSHIPMDHTAVIKFVENRFIGSAAHLTARDAAQPDLLDFFDFSAVPWSTPPSPPTPMSNATLGYAACTPTAMQ